MKLFYLVGIIVALVEFAPCQSVQGIYDLIARRIPQHCNSFTFSLVESDVSSKSNESVLDHYVVSSGQDGEINVQGNTLSAISYG